METPTPDPYDLGPSAVARITGLGVWLVQQSADDGSLPSIRTPGGHRRFRRSDVDAFIKSLQGPKAATS